MRDKNKQTLEEWYAEMNRQFEEDSKTNDYSDPEMDKWFYAMLDEKVREGNKKGTEEWYKEINKRFEEDSKTHDFSDSEMDKWFAEMLDKEMRKNRKRRVAKVASIAAGIVLLSSVVLNGFTEITYGKSLIQIIRNSIEAGQFTVSGIGNADDNNNQFEDYDEDTVRYEADSIEKIFEQIINDEKIEVDGLFYVEGLPEQYEKWTAKYNTKFHRLTISSQQKESYFHIYEELNYENVVSGTILESEIISTVFNENLQMDIDILKQTDSIRNEGYYLEVFCNDKRLKVEGHSTLEEFEVIVANITILKGKQQ